MNAYSNYNKHNCFLCAEKLVSKVKIARGEYSCRWCMYKLNGVLA